MTPTPEQIDAALRYADDALISYEMKILAAAYRAKCEEVENRCNQLSSVHVIAVKRSQTYEDQCDALAAACQMLMDVVDPPESSTWANVDDIDAAYLAGEKALAAMKGEL